MSDTQVQVVEPKKMLHPRSVQGRFRRLKTVIMIVAYATFFLLPWIPWSRAIGPNQAVVFDIPNRRYYIFDLVVHAQDIFWLMGLLFLAAVLLFFATSLLGRVFCGFFCFQTLWTDAFRLIEKIIQGDRVARLRLEKQAWNGAKLLKKGATHALWLFLAFWTGLTFVLYWGDTYPLMHAFFTGQAPKAAYFTAFLLMATTYIAAGWIKEYICLHICPYSRFQGVMFDQDTVLVAYDYQRGEGSSGRMVPKQALRDRELRQGKGYGDCVDCGLCVQVCPTGIDIRDGLQASCIHCALCIDACNNIMDKYGWERGLIRYASENELEGRKTKFLKLRTVGYGIATFIAVSYLLWSISTAQMLEATVEQVRSPLYVTLSDGSIQNSYELKITNKTQEPASYRVDMLSLDRVTMSMGQFDPERIEVGADTMIRLFVQVKQEPPMEGLTRNREFSFKIEPLSGSVTEPVLAPARFIIP